MYKSFLPCARGVNVDCAARRTPLSLSPCARGVNGLTGDAIKKKDIGNLENVPKVGKLYLPAPRGVNMGKM